MKYKQLGKTGIQVSTICLGTMSFGRWIDEATSKEILHTALNNGINFIDTANFYGKGQDTKVPYGTGESEEILGRALIGIRDEVVLATKVGLPMGRGVNDKGLSRKHITRQIDCSLLRLQTDYIDLYQVHMFDQHTPLEETLSALNDLVRLGKVRYIGCSNFAAWQIAKAHGISEKKHLEKFVSVQPQYSLLVRDIENEILPFCKSEDVGVIVYSPMARGLLSGKYNSPNDMPPESRASHGEAKLKELLAHVKFDLVRKYKKIADNYNVPLAQIALSWVLNQETVTSAIIGATKTHHITDAVVSSDWEMPEAILNEIESN